MSNNNNNRSNNENKKEDEEKNSINIPKGHPVAIKLESYNSDIRFKFPSPFDGECEYGDDKRNEYYEYNGND